MTVKSKYFEDINIGDEIPSLTKKITLLSLLQYSAATWDFHYSHIDEEFAKSRNLPGNIVDGQEFGAFFAQMITDWLGTDVTFKKMGITYRVLVIEGDTITCKGTVKDKFEENGDNTIHCDLIIENQRNERIANGYAVLSVKSK